MLPVEKLKSALADRYRIERELGAGGMATVYLASDLKHDRKVAIKVLKPELAAVLGAERFVVEIKTTAALQHPHILPLFDSGTADGFLYYVMPYIEGETIREKLNRETQFGVDEAVRIAREIADALDYAHRNGVIHRDIKPENILLHDGRAIVMDFGIALAVSAAAGGRMTETGLSLGTPHYMSPEQATAEKEITGRSDVYSLASVLYEMLAGQPPHIGGAAQQVIMKIITERAQPVTDLRKSVPEDVSAAIAQALEKLPADRFATAAEFFAALAGGSGAVRQRPISAAARTRDTRWRHIAMIAGGVAVASMALAAWAMLGRRDDDGTGKRVEFAFRTNIAANDRAVIAISPDGRRIVQAVKDSNGVSRLLTRELGSTAVTPIPSSEGATEVAFSPDGQWAAYTSNESGQAEIMVRRFPRADEGGKWKLSSDGGHLARWSADGRTIYHLDRGRTSIRAVGVAPGNKFSVGASSVVMTARQFGSAWDVDRKTGRIAITVPVSTSGARMVVMQNWRELFSRSGKK